LGWLAFGTSESMIPLLDSLRQGLGDLGYIEGQNLAIEARWAGRQQERLDDLAAELVRLAPDVIVSQATPSSLAVKKATSKIPIVAVSISDPVGSGLVASLAHPGGNLTGLGLSPPGLGSKRLQLLKESAPSISRVAVFWNPDNPVEVTTLAVTLQAAQDPPLNLAILPVPVKSAGDFSAAFQQALEWRADGAVFMAAAVSGCCMPQIVDFTVQNRLPALHDVRIAGPDSGGLMSYSANPEANYRHAATLVDKILRGANPADLPVEQPSTFELIVNIKAAQAIGLTIPPSILAQATEVIH
jgi:putative ABC transport system substrate-binding protein